MQVEEPISGRSISRGLSERNNSMHRCASPLRGRTRGTTPGEAPPCRDAPLSPHCAGLHSATPPSIRSDGTSVRCHALAARAIRLATGPRTTTAPGANAPGARAASVPATTSRESGWGLKLVGDPRRGVVHVLPWPGLAPAGASHTVPVNRGERRMALHTPLPLDSGLPVPGALRTPAPHPRAA